MQVFVGKCEEQQGTVAPALATCVLSVSALLRQSSFGRGLDLLVCLAALARGHGSSSVAASVVQTCICTKRSCTWGQSVALTPTPVTIGAVDNLKSATAA
jgi:hypothetical protein